MNCAACLHIDLDRKEMARYQFGHCAFEPLHAYKSLAWERDCKLFKPAAEEVAIARAVWMANPKSILQEAP